MMIRFRYSRGEPLKYLAHLDMMTLFERALRRASIPVAFSGGFNKRPQLIFGMPISLGLVSRAEYADILLKEPMEPAKFLEVLNSALPPGASVDEAAEILNKKNIMSAVRFARYRIDTGENTEAEQALSKLMEMKECFITKTKKDRKIIKDIRGGIISAEFREGCIDLFMTSGQNENIRPEEVIAALETISGSEIKLSGIYREELYVADAQGRPALPLSENAV